MRRYWHPIAAASQMKDRYTMKVRILGEDLILYKDRSGDYGLIEPNCAHRRMNMIYGIPEEHGLRCPYHGWLFDETGACTEQPYEETEDPYGRFKEKVTMKAYPVQAKAGLIFAYLGPAPAPLIPNYDVYALPGAVREVGLGVLNCNWLQCQENSLDPVHLEWLHVAWANFIREQLGTLDRDFQVQRKHAKIGFEEFEHGIIKRRYWEGGSEDDSEWKHGHPMVFPNILRQGSSDLRDDQIFSMGPSFQIRTPVDDTTTNHWYVMSHPARPGDPVQRDEDVPFFTVPVPQLDAEGQPVWAELTANGTQDPAAWVTQGAIADRTRENLGRSDIGIILFRQQLERNIRIVEDGGDPMEVYRGPANPLITFVTEHTRYANVTDRQGAATSFSKILDERAGKTKR
jgi:5,5'-dehydrodivanillate O-demethylase